MVVTHTKATWWEYEMETNFAGGPAGAAYAKTTPSGAAELTPCNYPYNEDQTFPMAEYMHEAVEAPGQDISTKLTITTGLNVVSGQIVQYMQNSTWLDLALGIAPVETGGGALPDTFLLHYDMGQNEFTAYGCRITEYILESSAPGAMKETIKFDAYDVVDEDVVADAAPFDATTAIANHEDVGTTTITIDAGAIVDLRVVKLTVTNAYSEEHAGSYFNKYPFLLKRDVEVEMEFNTYDEHLDDMLSETLTDPIDLVFTPLGKANFSATNMKTKPETVNINVVPQKGLVNYKVTYEIGGASVFTTPA